MIRAAVLAVLFLVPTAHAVASGLGGASSASLPTAADPGAGSVASPGLLSDPGNYSLAPAAPSILSPVAGGVVSTGFGSNGVRSSSIELDSGLIGSNTHAFVAVGAGQGPHWHDTPSVQGKSFAAGVSTALPFGSTLTITGGFENDRVSDRPGSRTGFLP